MDTQLTDSKTDPRILASVADNIAGLHEVAVQYKAGVASYGDVATIRLRIDGGKSKPTYDQTPDDSPESIASQCWSIAWDHAEQNGSNWYRIVLRHAVGKKGKQVEIPPIAFRVDPSAVGGTGNEPLYSDQVTELVKESRQWAKDSHAQVIAITKVIVDLGKNLGTVFEGAAKVFDAGMQRQQAVQDQQVALEIAKLQQSTEIKKWDMAAESLGPGFKLFWNQAQKSFGHPSGSGATVVQQQGNGKALPEAPGPSALAARLYSSISMPQWDKLATILGSEVMQLLQDALKATDDATVREKLEAFTAAAETAQLADMYAAFSDQQQTAVDDLRIASGLG